MNPAFIMLLVVAAVFLGFGLLPKRKAPVKTTGKPSFNTVAKGTERQPTPVPSKPYPAASGIPNLPYYSRGVSDDASSRNPAS